MCIMPAVNRYILVAQVCCFIKGLLSGDYKLVAMEKSKKCKTASCPQYYVVVIVEVSARADLILADNWESGHGGLLLACNNLMPFKSCSNLGESWLLNIL